MANNARFKIYAVDERTATPLSGMKVKAVFVDHFLRWENATVDHEIDGRTDHNGRYAAIGNTNCGEAGFCFRDNAGFYDTGYVKVPFEVNGGKPMPLLQWWKPDNQVVTVRLQRVEHPIPLFVKRVELRDYGSMSYAAVLSMCHAKLTRSDPRVKSALDYCSKFWTVDENPGMGNQGLYYYYDILSRALSVAGIVELEQPNGRKINWKNELAAKLLALQKPDGSWVNDNNRFWENDPVLVTSFAILTLALCD